MPKHQSSMAGLILGRIRDAQIPSSLIHTAMQSLSDGLRRLDMAYAVTGKAARIEVGIGKRVPKITVALLNHDASPELVARELAEMTFDIGQPFSLSDSGKLTYKDPRFFAIQPDHRIVLFAVSELPPAAQVRYQKRNLVKSGQGWNMVSPFFLLLDYLIKAMKRIPRYMESGDTNVKITGSRDSSDTIHVLRHNAKVSTLVRHIQEMIKQQTPGNAADHRFLEENHIEAVRHVALIVPEIYSFQPFEHIFQNHPAEIKGPTSKPGTCTASLTTPNSATPTSPSRTNSTRDTKPKEDIKIVEVTRPRDVIMAQSLIAPAAPPKNLPQATSSVLQSLQWAASTALCAILLTGLSPALMGGMANIMYGVPTIPLKIEIAIYTPTSDGLEDEIKNWIVMQDPKNFKIKNTVLYCKPENPDFDFEFVVPACDTTGSKHGYQIDIVLPSTAPLPPFHPASLNHTQWLQSLPVVPFGLALLHKLKLWVMAFRHNRSSQGGHASDVLTLLQQVKYMDHWCRQRPWKSKTIFDKDLRRNSRNRVIEYVNKSAHGPASKAGWIRLGLLK